MAQVVRPCTVLRLHTKECVSPKIPDLGLTKTIVAGIALSEPFSFDAAGEVLEG